MIALVCLQREIGQDVNPDKLGRQIKEIYLVKGDLKLQKMGFYPPGVKITVDLAPVKREPYLCPVPPSVKAL